MSLVSEPGKLPEHKPSSGFIFDEEVSSIFDDMAHRSIPNYATVHGLHTNLIMPRYHFKHFKGEMFRVLDIGASTGKTFESICSHLHMNKTECPQGFEGWALDVSRPMIDIMNQKVPWVNCVEGSISNPDIVEILCTQAEGEFDVISMMYTLQFIPQKERTDVINHCFDLLKPGGMLLMAQKEDMGDNVELDKNYHSWRTMQGYSVEEIAMKTKALADTMWVEKQSKTQERCFWAGFEGFCETTRWLQFTSTMAFKPED